MKSHPLFEKTRIFAPGPTPVPEEVLAALARSPMHHRTAEFSALLKRVRENLGFLYQTQQPTYVLSASGTGAMEAALTNCFSPGDEVVVINGGKFGERWMNIARKYALTVHEIPVQWGHGVDPQQIKAALAQHPRTRGVLIQACETSTGVLHPIEECARVVRENSGALFVVDAITALGVCPLPMDAWGLDIVISGSQKALMLPPGLSTIALSQRARDARDTAKLPRYYFDLKFEDKALLHDQSAWTPAVSLIAGLDVVLARFRELGLQSVYDHHARLAEATRRGVHALGLELFAKTHPAPSLTAALMPGRAAIADKVIALLRQRYGITLAEGQDAYQGKMIRIAHLGYFDDLDMLTVLSALELVLKLLGVPVQLGAGVAAASSYFVEKESPCLKA